MRPLHRRNLISSSNVFNAFRLRFAVPKANKNAVRADSGQEPDKGDASKVGCAVRLPGVKRRACGGLTE